MKKAILLAITATITLSSCDFFQTKKAMELNNQMAAINADLNSHGKQWGEAFVKATGTKDYSILTPIRAGMDTSITGNITRLTAMENVAGSEDFKNAELDFLHFEQTSVSTVFKSFEELNANSTQEELDAKNAQMTDVGNKESELLNHLQQVQAAYAKKNNFNIEPAKK